LKVWAAVEHMIRMMVWIRKIIDFKMLAALRE
jgi:hypothetical protein